MMSRTHTRITLVSIVALAAGLCGCTTDERYEAIKADPAPEMLTLNERVVDADNAWTVSRNENWRMFWQDMSRAAMVDRPSRLTKETIPRP